MPTRRPATAVTAERFGCRPARWALAILIAAKLVGDVLMPVAIERFPLLLILLSPRWRTLLLVSRRLNAGLLVCAVVPRRLLTIVVAHRLGSCAIGRARQPRIPTRPAHGRSRWFRGWFRRPSAALLVVFPGASAALLAGTEHVRLRRAVALASVGTAVRLLVLLHVGRAFAAPLEQVIRFLGAHHLQITGLILTCVVVRVLRTSRRSRQMGSSPQPQEEMSTNGPWEQPSLPRRELVP